MTKIINIISVLILVITTGCVGISYTSQTVTAGGVTNNISIKANRFFWSTESYNCIINTNGTGQLTANKSSVDTAALTAVVSAAITAAKP